MLSYPFSFIPFLLSFISYTACDNVLYSIGIWKKYVCVFIYALTTRNKVNKTLLLLHKLSLVEESEPMYIIKYVGKFFSQHNICYTCFCSKSAFSLTCATCITKMCLLKCFYVNYKCPFLKISCLFRQIIANIVF